MTNSDASKDTDGIKPAMHRTLARLLRLHKLTPSDAPTVKDWQALLADVSAVYTDDDADRKMLERAVEVSSTEMRALNKRLTKQATTDAMTGLLNRSSLMAALDRFLCEQRQGESNTLGVLFIDLDGFKLINDRLGHAVGDELLCIIAQRLKSCVRDEDPVARFGGDEFVILLPTLPDTASALAIAQRIVSNISQTICLPDAPPMGVGASIGVTTVSESQPPTAERLLLEADLAMYSAKTTGRNRVVAFTPALESRDANSATEELRQAIVNGELVLHYQPIVCLAHQRVVAMEALARWNHSERGMIPPAEFIPLAENSGLIHDLTRSVLAQALIALAAWPDDLLVTVNLSSKDLAHHGTIDVLKEQMNQSGVDLGRVVLEITEHSLVSWDASVIDQLHSILNTGIRLAIDDFGSGYSSLSQLVDLPIQIVKLDRKFVESVSELETSQAIVRTIVELARTLGLMVVAEGIETAEQADVLQNLGCDLAQGYHFGRPGPDLVHDEVGCKECAFVHSGMSATPIAVGQ